jgi:hypothetical protein
LAIASTIVRTLGENPPQQSAMLIAATVECLQTEDAVRGRRVVVICDEARPLAAG